MINTAQFDYSIFSFRKFFFLNLLLLIVVTACQSSKKIVANKSWLYFNHSDYLNPDDYIGYESRIKENDDSSSEKGYQPPKAINSSNFHKKVVRNSTLH